MLIQSFLLPQSNYKSIIFLIHPHIALTTPATAVLTSVSPASTHRRYLPISFDTYYSTTHSTADDLVSQVGALEMRNCVFSVGGSLIV